MTLMSGPCGDESVEQVDHLLVGHRYPRMAVSEGLRVVHQLLGVTGETVCMVANASYLVREPLHSERLASGARAANRG